MQIVNQAFDEVRRQERRETDLLKKTCYQWLKNPANLTSKQKTSLEDLSRCHLKTGRAYRIKLAFKDLFTKPDRESGEAQTAAYLLPPKKSSFCITRKFKNRSCINLAMFFS
ncbi:Transposase IS204/IS1001/IS1096/IS1165 [Moorella glycerini]|uniref:Transposase IS204/IS1001/IS1096/IS1165 DDE domain-containing protein n=2 Tax=Neomoorella stamsii TaxID=1266720 RepID=A0A9X7P786_9FIRM|nr:hypothetical protein MOST_05140 [Moorella stamsii]CEP67084.1 Transposase IS204/IS1001/IS1096/IS1165 [Moorella glycerini]